MSVQLTPSKRASDRSHQPNGKGKWQKLGGFQSPSLNSKVSPGTVVFRVLCPSSKSGSVIGKGGSVISKIRQETGVKVKVEDTVPGCDERVVSIAGRVKETEEDAEQSKEGGGKVVASNGMDDGTKDDDENNEVKDPSPVEDSKHEQETSSVQKALLLVSEKIIEAEDTDEGGAEKGVSFYNLRVLVLSSQVGCLLGKGGCVIKQMSADSGAQIRILPRDKLPLCASVSDDLVQITGSSEAVKKALQYVSQQILEHPPQDQDLFSANSTGPPSHSTGHFLPPYRSFTSQEAAYPAGSRDDFHHAGPPNLKFHEGVIPGRMGPPQEVMSFRLLCNAERVGGIIGKGGMVIKTLQQETSCEIKVVENATDSEERIIIVSGPLHPDDGVSPAQDAVLRVQSRIMRNVPDSKDQTVMARMLVSSNQIGCLLGKGGSVIAEMRKSSGAYIRILGKDQVPKCASEDEEVVQIHGEVDAVQDALLQITNKLRHHFFRDAFSSINHPSNSAFLDPPFPPYMRRREFSPPGIYSNLGPPFHKFDAVGGPPPPVGFHPHDDRSHFMHNIHRPGVPPHLSERKPWGHQGLIEGGPIGLSDLAPLRRIPGGSQQAIITNTTVEVVVPRSVVPAINGEDGECLTQIRQISDAKITITEPKPGAVETIIIISGTPEQTHAAQSLIQAFVMIETESS